MSTVLGAKLSPAQVALKYAQDVLNGQVIAGKLVQCAAQRFLDDLIHGRERDLWFDENAAAEVVSFIALLPHPIGEWGTDNRIVLEPWEVFIIVQLFGWKYISTGLRRYDEAYIEMARKNGKSTLAAAIALYMFLADGEPAAHVFCAALTRDQARIIFEDHARAIVKHTPDLAAMVVSSQINMNVPDTGSKFEPCSSEAKNLDGKNSHCVILDELALHPNDAVYSVMKRSRKTRKQPQLISITYAGVFDSENIAWKKRELSLEILNNKVPKKDTDYFFAFIAAMDEGDDWQDEKNWGKANPNLGVCIDIKRMRHEAGEAIRNPTELSDFKRASLNVWVMTHESWLSPGMWDANAEQSAIPLRERRTLALQSLRRRRCYVGIDMAVMSDMASVVFLFPPCEETMASDPVTGKPVVWQAKDDKWRVVVFYWYPEETVKAELQTGKLAPYESWGREGYVDIVPGSQINQEKVCNTILEIVEKYDLRVQEIGYDPYSMDWMAPKLEAKGFVVVKVPQKVEYMDPVIQHFGALLADKKIEHYANPILVWNAGNVVIQRDSQGLKKFDKKQSRNKIDGVSAMAVALQRAVATMTPNQDDPDRFKVRFLDTPQPGGNTGIAPKPAPVDPEKKARDDARHRQDVVVAIDKLEKERNYGVRLSLIPSWANEVFVQRGENPPAWEPKSNAVGVIAHGYAKFLDARV